MKAKNTPQKHSGLIAEVIGKGLKRGQFVSFKDVKGKKFTGFYTKMQNGNLCFIDLIKVNKYQLNKAGYLIPC